jgi:hypothetical protein
MKLKIAGLILCFPFLSSCLSRQIIVLSPESFDDVSRNMKTPIFGYQRYKIPTREFFLKKK